MNSDTTPNKYQQWMQTYGALHRLQLALWRKQSFDHNAESLSSQKPWDDAVNKLNSMVFGNSSFRPQQREAINAALMTFASDANSKSIFLSLPTGGGKSNQTITTIKD